MKKILSVILACLFVFSTVYAAAPNSEYVDAEYKVTVSGTATGDFTIYIVETGETLLDGEPVYIRPFNYSGNYTVHIPLDKTVMEVGQEYDLYVSGLEDPYTFEYVDIGARNEYINDTLNDETTITSATALYNEIANNGLATLGIDEISQDIADILYKRMPFENLPYSVDFKNKFEASSVLDAVNKAASNSDIKDLLIANADCFEADIELDFVGTEEEAPLSAEVIDKLCSLLKTQDYSQVLFDETDDANGAYKDARTVALCFYAESWSDLAGYIQDGDIPGIDTTLTNFNDICEVLIYDTAQFDTTAKIAELFNAIANPPEDGEGEGEGEGEGGGSGGGGGGGGGGIIAETVKPEPEETTPDVDVVTPGKNEEVSAGTSDFVDLVGYDWAKGSIERMRRRGIITGVSDTQFAPAKGLTRAELAKLIAEAFDLDAGTASFNDVAEGNWYYDCVARCATAGIILGSDGNFYPENFVTRQDAALMIHRALEFKGIFTEGEYVFYDNDNIASYAKEAVEALARNKVLSGTGGNYFEPYTTINRASAAVLIENAFNFSIM